MDASPDENAPCAQSNHAGERPITSPTTDRTIRELDCRTSDGINVRLLWNSVADRVVVAVHDTRNDEAFELLVALADALLAFHHPYANANRPPDGHSIVV
jgi:hypothetical protein